MTKARYQRPIHSQRELRDALADVLEDLTTDGPKALKYDDYPRVLYALQIIGSSLRTEQATKPTGRPKEKHGNEETSTHTRRTKAAKKKASL